LRVTTRERREIAHSWRVYSRIEKSRKNQGTGVSRKNTKEWTFVVGRSVGRIERIYERERATGLVSEIPGRSRYRYKPSGQTRDRMADGTSAEKGAVNQLACGRLVDVQLDQEGGEAVCLPLKYARRCGKIRGVCDSCDQQIARSRLQDQSCEPISTAAAQ